MIATNCSLVPRYVDTNFDGNRISRSSTIRHNTHTHRLLFIEMMMMMKILKVKMKLQQFEFVLDGAFVFFEEY